MTYYTFEVFSVTNEGLWRWWTLFLWYSGLWLRIVW